VTSGRFTIEAFGDAALRVRFAEDAPQAIDRRALLAALRAHDRVVDAVVTEAHALVTFDPESPPEGIDRAIDAALQGTGAPAPAPRHHVVRVRYDGEDLEAIASAAGRSTRDVVALHAAGTYTAAAIGFLPGFAYLRGLDPGHAVPRRATPRSRIAALRVAVAGPYTAIYPFASPGGWNLIGTAIDFAPFDAGAGARLALGDRVTFVPEAP
jgi:UPF0271 protein